VWAYSGWNAATYVAEEVRSPERTLPSALAAGTAIVAALYLGLNVVFLYSTPIPALAERTMGGEIAIGSQAAFGLFGERISGVFSGLMALAIVSSVNAMVTVGPRVYYAMAKNRAFLPAAAAVHPRWHTPVVAIVSQGLCAMLMTLTPFPDLIIYIGLSLTLFSVLTVASVFVFRKKRPEWQKLRALNFAWPMIPISYIAVGACMMTYGLMKHPMASCTAFATVGAGALVYRVASRKLRDSSPGETA
jgi:basic amino acid/polyamine antiporter, APA family